MPKCRWCAHMIAGDANWCQEKRRCCADSHLGRERPCPDYVGSPLDAVTLEGRPEPTWREAPPLPGQGRLSL